MSIEPITRPLPGERVLALAPETLTEAHGWLLRRPNLFPGRSLTAAALQGRQDWGAHHVSLRGQAFTAGVVRGLEAAFGSALPARIDDVRLALQRGVGLCVTGEDVRVARAADVRFGDLPVVADPSLFTGGGGAGGSGGTLTSKVVGDRLSTLLAGSPVVLPRAGILVLQPVTADRIGEFDASDPCLLNGCDGDVQGAFEDWRIGDGGRLLWYAWPEEWRPLPPVPLTAPALWRNLLAWEIFEAEQALRGDEVLPWEQFGLPLAVVGCDSAWTPMFLDRASVVRSGGRPRFSRPSAAAAGLHLHWRQSGLRQARFEQLAEQITDAVAGGVVDAGALAAGFGRVPPFGLLPPEVVDLDPESPGFMRCGFFPSLFQLDAAPLPEEVLDAALAESAALGPLDFSQGGRVRLLVPVPQALFEPRLLIREVIDPEFLRTLDEFLVLRARFLGARQALRRRAAVLAHGLTGRTLQVPAIEDDPDALEPEQLSPWGPPPAGGGHRTAPGVGLHEQGFEAAEDSFDVAADERLVVWVYLDPDDPPRSLMLQWHSGDWEHRVRWGEDLIDIGTPGTPGRVQNDTLPPTGQWVELSVPASKLALEGATVDGMRFTLYDGRAAFATAGALDASGALRTWFAGRLPAGAREMGDERWQTLAHNDLWAPFEAVGLLTPLDAGTPPAGGGHTTPPAEGRHQYLFENASPVFTPAASESLFTWVCLDPSRPPTQLMLQWRVGGSWEHRAYWGLSRIGWGVEGSASRRRMGALPQPGRWLRLQVPAADVGLDGQAIDGMAFTFFDGSAAFGVSGALGEGGEERPWFADKPPGKADVRGSWQPLSERQMADPTTAGDTGELQPLTELYQNRGLAHLSEQERYQIYQLGLEGFVSYLKSRADRADDLVDYGFVKVQTDIYRVRQLVLGTTAATRLAISPALASIAKADTAVASNERISSFFDELKVGQTAGAVAAKSAARSVAAGPPPAAAAPAARATGKTAIGKAVDPGPAGVSNAGSFDIGARGDAVDLGGKGGAIDAGAKGGWVDLGDSLVLDRADDGRVDIGAGKDTGIELVLAGQRFTPEYITNGAPIVGKAEVRTVSIAERLEAPKAAEAKNYTSSTRYEAVRNLMELADELTVADGGEAPGLFDGVVFHGLRGDPVLFYESEDEVESPDKPLPDLDDPEQQATLNGLRRSLPFRTLLAERWRLPLLLRAPLRTNIDESAQFSDSADLSDNTVALMRQVEGRVKQYRDAIAIAESLIGGLRRQAAANESRLGSIGGELAEARHDVALTRALIAEEEARLDAINERRARTLREHVKFIAYQRPREAELIMPAPMRQLHPGLLPAPVPSCLKAHQDAPDELADLLAVVREAPARWFVAAKPIVDGLDRVDLLVRTVQTAQLRAQLMDLRLAAQPAYQSTPGIAGAIAGLQNRRQRSVKALRGAAARVDAVAVAGLSWQRAREEADRVISLGDLIDGEHGRGEVARRAAALFEQISRICACAHEAFSAVSPALRLEWAQQMSQFDESPRLRNLASLTRFGELDYELRRALQAFADWLFGQVQGEEAEALVNDLLRMCLLLASHAPVDQIVAGHLPEAATARPGMRLPMRVPQGRKPRIGMQALVYKLDRVVARARVDDLHGAEVSATVLQVEGVSVDLSAQTRVQFIAADAPAAMPAASPRILPGR